MAGNPAYQELDAALRGAAVDTYLETPGSREGFSLGKGKRLDSIEGIQLVKGLDGREHRDYA